jgi:hypothetical protein
MHPLRVAKSNPHFLETEPGKRFFLLGDTAWELFHRLTFDQATTYLNIRHEQRFNCVLANVLPEFAELRPSAMGFPVLDGPDSDKPNQGHFDHIARVIGAAAKSECYVGLVCAWGDKVTAPWGAGPKLFTPNDPDRARRFGKMLATRFGQANVFYVLGGDRPPTLQGFPEAWYHQYAADLGFDPNTDWRPIWRAMAEGILEVRPDAFLTYHPQGGEHSTMPHLHHEQWLHLNAIQSGHGGGRDNRDAWRLMERDFAAVPPKPTLDMEPNYEDHPVSPWPTYHSENGYFRDLDVRKQVYRSVFAGGAGVVYGHHSIWQFWDDRYELVNFADRHWTNAIHRAGAKQLKHLRHLMEERGTYAPDQTVIANNPAEIERHRRACRADDGSWVMVYLPVGEAVELSSGWSVASKTWFNPRTGEKSAGSVVPPTSEDWVLILTR